MVRKDDDTEATVLALELSTIEPPDSDETDDEIEEGDGLPGFAPERVISDTPADLELEDATLEWSQDDEDLGEE